MSLLTSFMFEILYLSVQGIQVHQGVQVLQVLRADLFLLGILDYQGVLAVQGNPSVRRNLSHLWKDTECCPLPW